MAIAYNLPSEREAAEENFSRLNRLLAELYEVLCHILVSRQAGEPQEAGRRDRPYSESDIERPSTAPVLTRRSASSPPLTLTFEADLDDDVFISPRVDNGSDPFTNRPVEIFTYTSMRTPAGVPLSPRRERSFTFAVTNEKHWRDKGGTEEGAREDIIDADVTDAPLQSSSKSSSSSSIFTSILPDKLSGSICTALLVVLGWKFLLNKR